MKKLAKKQATADVLGQAGMSAKGKDLFLAAADAEYVANMSELDYKAVSAHQQMLDNAVSSAASASVETVKAAGCKTNEEYKKQLEKEASEYRDGDYAKAEGRYNKTSKAAKKAESEMKNHFASREGRSDGSKYERLQKGDYATGREAENSK